MEKHLRHPRVEPGFRSNGDTYDGARSLRTSRTKADHWLGAVALVMVVAIGLFAGWYMHGATSPPRYVVPEEVKPAPLLQNPARKPGTTKPAHPVAPAQLAEGEGPPPTLATSDAALTKLMNLLASRRDVMRHLRLDGFIRRFVATVDNLPRDSAPASHWPVKPPKAGLDVVSMGTYTMIGPDNELRHAPFILFVESLDPAALVQIYQRMYPLFQQAYEELGYPGSHFNDRLIAVIDHLLEAPEPAEPLIVELVQVQGPVQYTRPWLHYEFVDPELQSLSAGQKIMIRVGLVNERRLKARLAYIRAALLQLPGDR